MLGGSSSPDARGAFELLLHDAHGGADLGRGMLGSDEEAEPRRLQGYGRIDDRQDIEPPDQEPLGKLPGVDEVADDDGNDRVSLAGSGVEARLLGERQEESSVGLNTSNPIRLGLQNG